MLLGSIGVGYALRSGKGSRPDPLNDPFIWVVSNDNGVAEIIDPGDNGLDPSAPQTQETPCARYDKNVASSTAVFNVSSPYNISVIVDNAYPGYWPTIFFGVKNMSTYHAVIQTIEIDENAATPDEIEDIAELTVTVAGMSEGQIVDPGEEATGSLQIYVEQMANQNTTYTIRVSVVTVPALGGTTGFWGAWDKHKTYTEKEINTWLVDIDADSQWLVDDMDGKNGINALDMKTIFNKGNSSNKATMKDKDGNNVIDVRDMEAIFDNTTGSRATMKDKFLGHYLATRLDVEAGRLHPDVLHDFSAYDPDDYLGLGGSGTLTEIIDAIESKYRTQPTNDQYELMKTICDRLNNVEI